MKSRILMLAILASIALSLVSFVAADVANFTISQPATGDTVSGTAVLLNGTSNVTGTLGSITNVTWQVRCTNTVNSSYTTVNITGNATKSGGTNHFSTRFDSTGVEDSSICEIKGYLANNDTGDLTNTVSRITVDNTVPNSLVVPVGRQLVKTDTVSFNLTTTAARAIRCIYTFPQRKPGNVDTGNVTESAGGCSLSLSRLNVPDGIYQYIVRVTDETNSTDSAVGEVEVSRSNDMGKLDDDDFLTVDQINVRDKKQAFSTYLFWAGLAYAIYFLFFKK